MSEQDFATAADAAELEAPAAVEQEDQDETSEPESGAADDEQADGTTDEL